MTTIAQGRPSEFKPFEPLEHANLSINYLTEMTDAKLGYLPYGVVVPFKNPPFAEHNRIDDALLVPSWYEGLSCAREMAGSERGAAVEEALLNKLLGEGWDDNSGLRFPVRRPWSGKMDYCLISEMATVLSALNRALEVSPKNKLAEKRSADLVAGLRKLVVESKIRAVEIGEVGNEETCFSFPVDVYVLGKGLTPEISTGFSDWELRCSVLITPLVKRYALTEDEAALDLAVGLANRITAISHFFTMRNEFSGQVHSAIWTASGLARLGRVAGQDRYIAKAKGLYDYVRRNSSAFGWVPEYMQWQLIADERCEAFCIKDMMECALELVDCGFPEYWDDIHRFWRNHLAQSQLADTGFMPDTKSPADTEMRTYKNMPARLLGGCFGGSAPNGMLLSRYNSISGYASGVAPQGMLLAWRRAIEYSRGTATINFPVNCENEVAQVRVGYPNEGAIRVKLKKACRVIVRVFPWMPTPHEGTRGGRPAALERRDDQVSFSNSEKGAELEFTHELKMRRVLENVMGLDFFGLWRGADMVDILPHGQGYRLYQRGVGVAVENPVFPEQYEPKAEVEHLIEPENLREARLNRRKAPRN